MIRILHCADVHLDSPFVLDDFDKAQARRNELRGTFTSLMMYIREKKIDIAIIAGDLFDKGFATKRTADLLKEQFARVKDCRFIIAPGNHDPYERNGIYGKQNDFPPNVYIFNSEKVTRFSFDSLNVDIYGYAFTSPKMTQNPLATVQVVNRDRINILAAHGELGNPLSQNCPLRQRDIVGAGFDYVALGHIHLGTDIQYENGTYYAYSGCLEGRAFDECGQKSVIVGELEKKDGKLSAEFARVSFARKRYEKTEIDITGASDDISVARKINEYITKNALGSDTLLRVRLFGNTVPEYSPDKKTIEEQIRSLFYIEILDDTLPLFDYEYLKNDITVKGAFFRCLLPLLESDDENERKVASEALKYGFAALHDEDIIL